MRPFKLEPQIVNYRSIYIGLLISSLAMIIGMLSTFISIFNSTFVFPTIWIISGIAITVVANYLYRDYLNPFAVWSLFWVTIVGVAFVVSISTPWLGSWLPVTWGCVLLATFGFAFGYMSVMALLNQREDRYRYSWMYEIYDWRKLEKYSLVLLAISELVYIVLIIRHGIPLFSANPDIVRVKFQEQYYWSIVNFAKVSCLIWALSSKKGKLFSFMVGTYLFSLLLTGWRGTLLHAIIFILVGQNLRHKISLKKLLVFALVLLVIFYGVGYLRSVTIVNKPMEILYYVAPSFINFQDITLRQSERTWGIYSLRGIYQVFLPHLVSRIKASIPSAEVMGYNVSTYMSLPFVDWGIPGVAIISGVIGIITAYSYYRVRKKISLQWAVLFTSSIIGIIGMHNGFFWQSSSWMYWVVLAYLGHLLAKKKTLRKQENNEGASRSG